MLKRENPSLIYRVADHPPLLPQRMIIRGRYRLVLPEASVKTLILTELSCITLPSQPERPADLDLALEGREDW